MVKPMSAVLFIFLLQNCHWVQKQQHLLNIYLIEGLTMKAIYNITQG